MEDDSLRILEHAGVGIAQVGLDGRFLQVNRRMTELWGYTAEELSRLTIQEIAYPDDMSIDWLSGFFEGRRETLKTEKRYVHKNGHAVTVELSVTPVRSGGQILYLVFVLEDISERKRAEELLRRQKQVLELMARNVSLGETLASIVQLIEDQAPGVLSGILLVEDRYLRLGAAPSLPEEFHRGIDGCPIGPDTGTCAAAAFHRRPWFCSDVEKDPVWGALAKWALSFGIRAAWSNPVLRADGKVLGTVCMTWNEVGRTPTQRDKELVGVATHLTGLAIERCHNEQLIIEQQVKLVSASKMAALGEMAGGLAHEINNPLAIIHAKANQLELLAGVGALSPPDVVGTAEKIRATAMRISKIVKGLRSYARDGEHDPFQTVSAPTLLADALELCRERFKNHEVDLRVAPVPETLTLECRPVQLVQVLLNLLSNSYDAVLSLPERWIELDVDGDTDHVVFAVSDSGPGIPLSLRDKITQPFFTTKEAGKGTGLGLSIAAGIVTSHHGTLELDDAAPNTRFVVRLPSQQRSAT